MSRLIALLCEITGGFMQKVMTEEQAMEYFDFNVVGSWVGETTPIFLYTGEEY